MTVRFLLHGVPETAAIWRDVAPRLVGEVELLSLPGFGAPVPDGFDCSMYGYEAWLLDQLAAAAEPVDLVGHDWGGILTARVATLAPAGLRSWVTDAAGALRPAFEWHDLGKLWMTDAGEGFFAGMMADRAGSAELLAAYGLSPEHATALVAEVDQTMADSILALYRSSAGLGSEWVVDGPSPVPGALIASADDPLAGVRVAREMADLLGVELSVLDHGGHFWPIENADGAADVLNSFWATLG